MISNNNHDKEEEKKEKRLNMGNKKKYIQISGENELFRKLII